VANCHLEDSSIISFNIGHSTIRQSLFGKLHCAKAALPLRGLSLWCEFLINPTRSDRMLKTIEEQQLPDVNKTVGSYASGGSLNVGFNITRHRRGHPD
jgi:hypothetical protein